MRFNHTSIALQWSQPPRVAFVFKFQNGEISGFCKVIAFMWLENKLFNWTLGNGYKYLWFDHFGVTLRCWRSILQRKEHLAVFIFANILSLPSACPGPCPPAARGSGWPGRARISSGVLAVPSSVNCVISQMLENYCWFAVQSLLLKIENRKIMWPLTFS